MSIHVCWYKPDIHSQEFYMKIDNDVDLGIPHQSDLTARNQGSYKQGHPTLRDRSAAGKVLDTFQLHSLC